MCVKRNIEQDAAPVDPALLARQCDDEIQEGADLADMSSRA
jgi:hypothetical protein